MDKVTEQWRYREDIGYEPYTWKTTSSEGGSDIEYRLTPDGCNCIEEGEEFCFCPDEYTECPCCNCVSVAHYIE